MGWNTPTSPPYPGWKSPAFPLISKWPKMIRLDNSSHVFFNKINILSTIELTMERVGQTAEVRINIFIIIIFLRYALKEKTSHCHRNFELL